MYTLIILLSTYGKVTSNRRSDWWDIHPTSQGQTNNHGKVVVSNDCYTMDTVFNSGHSVAEKSLASPQECQEWCQLIRLCKYFSFNTNTNTCFLRQGNTARTRAGYISGPKNCQTTTTVGPPTCNETMGLCLVGGSTPEEGNVLVGGKPVCDDEWDLKDAAVVCRQLGFPGVREATVESTYGPVSPHFAMDQVACFGNETSLSSCYHSEREDCFDNEGAGVICAQVDTSLAPECHQVDQLCLSGGPDTSQGNVYLGGHPVCHNGWDFPDANVVCRALGFPGAVDFTLRSHFGPGQNFFLISQVDCRGDETSILACPHVARGLGCDSSTVAGVHCVVDIQSSHQDTGLYVFLGVLGALTLFVLVLGVTYLRKRMQNKKVNISSSLGFTAPTWKRDRSRPESTNTEDTEEYNGVYTAPLTDVTSDTTYISGSLDIPH